MYSFYGTSARFVEVGELCVPCEGFGGAACHAGDTRYAEGGTSAWEMLLEDATVVVLFFVHRGIDREAFRSMRHLFIGDGCVGDGFQGVYPYFLNIPFDFLTNW